ncbi:serine/threonine-protein kinase [Photobacterium chitinilyticum]|uniref:Serine/threonine protein kinase n=1 Tax=Photobacterium chitinilyticum TaxID=2485123 RepID=A0A444JVW7_9GAMM|nr:serine/threonine-protein kinase [Photobacterium chitinilyticum]RWX57224.1 serine/threonine protein kinase [Photobacterium chitinilyticum]
MENTDKINISKIKDAVTDQQGADNSASDKTRVSTRTTRQTGDLSSSQSPAISNNISLKGNIIKGRYRIEALIGHGGMCDVYQATDLLLEASGSSAPYVALKILQREYLNQPGAAKILIREAQKTQQLSHPNIIRVYDFGGEKQAHYLVMEWLDGETLEEVIRRSRPNGLNYKSAAKVLNQVIAALKYAHSQGVVHADLKPSNIMLTRDGTIKLFDFGVSRAFNLHADDYSTEVQNETNALSGYTPTYASPNLLQGKEPEAKDDIFAFSAIAYELLTSQHPFMRKPADLAQKSQMKAKKPRHLSPYKWYILRQGLHFQADSRLESFSDLDKRINIHFGPVVTALVAACCVAVTIGYGYQQNNIKIEQLSANLQQSKQTVLDVQKLTKLSASELLTVIPTLSKQKPLLIDGLLRHKQQQVLTIYEHRINTILNNRKERYPDYYAVEKELLAAQALYPDSKTLQAISEDISTSWQSTVEMLVQRLNAALEKGQYQPSDNTDIHQLLADLTLVKRNYQFKPTAKAHETFSSAFDHATKMLDLLALKQLINVGELIFANSPTQQELLASGKKLKGSIQILADYQAQLNEGYTPEFPYKAAALYYKNSFDELNEKLSKIKNVTQLDSLNKDVETLAGNLPNDFSHLIQMRLSLATQYLDFSENLLKANKVRTANMVMKKANNLFTEVEKARSAY